MNDYISIGMYDAWQRKPSRTIISSFPLQNTLMKRDAIDAMYFDLVGNLNKQLKEVEQRVEQQKIEEEQERLRKIQEQMELERKRREEEERKRKQEEEERRL